MSEVWMSQMADNHKKIDVIQQLQQLHHKLNEFDIRFSWICDRTIRSITKSCDKAAERILELSQSINGDQQIRSYSINPILLHQTDMDAVNNNGDERGPGSFPRIANVGFAHKVFDETLEPKQKENSNQSRSEFKEKSDDSISLNKIPKQIGNVKEYYDSFNKFLNQLQPSQDYAVRCFIEGLKEDIQNEVYIFNPKTVHQAYCLAKLQENVLEYVLKSQQSKVNSSPHVVRNLEEFDEKAQKGFDHGFIAANVVGVAGKIQNINASLDVGIKMEGDKLKLQVQEPWKFNEAYVYQENFNGSHEGTVKAVKKGEKVAEGEAHNWHYFKKIDDRGKIVVVKVKDIWQLGADLLVYKNVEWTPQFGSDENMKLDAFHLLGNGDTNTILMCGKETKIVMEKGCFGRNCANKPSYNYKNINMLVPFTINQETDVAVDSFKSQSKIKTDCLHGRTHATYGLSKWEFKYKRRRVNRWFVKWKWKSRFV